MQLNVSYLLTPATFKAIVIYRGKDYSLRILTCGKAELFLGTFHSAVSAVGQVNCLTP